MPDITGEIVNEDNTIKTATGQLKIYTDQQKGSERRGTIKLSLIVITT